MNKHKKLSLFMVCIMATICMSFILSGCRSKKLEYSNLQIVSFNYSDLSTQENRVMETNFRANFKNIIIEGNKFTLNTYNASIYFTFSENDGSLYSKNDYKYTAYYNGMLIGLDFTDNYVKYFASYPQPYRCEALYVTI